MKRLLQALLVAGALVGAGLAGVAIWMRTVDSAAANWHVDLATVERPGSPNDYLVATPGYTRAAADRGLLAEDEPGSFLREIDAVAVSEPRTERLAGTAEEGRITYIQRSPVFGFPDYVTVQAGPEGRAIWSRSRFGRDDLDVNRARVERWLSLIGG